MIFLLLLRNRSGTVLNIEASGNISISEDQSITDSSEGMVYASD